MIDEFGRLCKGDSIKYYMAIEPYIRQKSGQKFNDEKEFLAKKADADPIDMLLLYMEACGMQSRQTFVSEPFLKKCIQLVLEESKSLTDKMFAEVHAHIMDIIREMLRKSKFNRTIQSRLQQDTEREISRLKDRTSDFLNRLFETEISYPFWEPDQFDELKEEPEMSFYYRKSGQSNGKEEACSLSKQTLKKRFESNLSCKIKDDKSTKDMARETIENVPVN